MSELCLLLAGVLFGISAACFINRLRMTTDAATALTMLQAENAKLRVELEQVKFEKDMAVEEMRGDCEKCAHYRVIWNGCTPDYECPLSDQCLNRDMWQWRGLKEA